MDPGKPSHGKGAGGIWASLGVSTETQLVHPEMEDPEKKHAVSSSLQAVYSTTEKLKDHYLTSKAISKLMANLIKGLPAKFEETLPAWLLQN